VGPELAASLPAVASCLELPEDQVERALGAIDEDEAAKA